MVVTLIVAIIAFISWWASVIEFRDLLAKYGFNFVKPIEYDKSDFYNQSPSALWNLERRDYVFPNDRLNYDVLLESKLPYQIDIESDMQVFDRWQVTR